MFATGSENGSLQGLVALEQMAAIQLGFQSHSELQLTPPFPVLALQIPIIRLFVLLLLFLFLPCPLPLFLTSPSLTLVSHSSC